MFKKVAVLFCLFLLFSGVFSIRLVDPISKTLNNNDYVGSVVSGSELELIFSKEFGRFSNIEVKNTLPNGFDIKIEDYLESIKVFIKIPDNALKSDYHFEVTMKGKEEKSLRLYFIVDDNLLDSSLNNYFSESYVGEDAVYEFSLVNNSHADVKFTINPIVPFSWTKNLEYTFTVPKKSVLKEKILINPQVSGPQNFDIIVNNAEEKKEFSVLLNSKPTLLGKNKVFLNGLPFYSISLSPSYFFNSLIASFFN